jgi:hypothetical protein
MIRSAIPPGSDMDDVETLPSEAKIDDRQNKERGSYRYELRV